MANRFLWETIGVIVLTFLVTLSIKSFYLIPGLKQGLIALTVIGQIFLLGLLVLMIARPELLDEVRKGAKQLAFTVALIATSGSLFYSEVAGYFPCKLCWFQRIFMYPLVILLGIALYKKEDIKEYVAPMTVLGGGIALYHYIIQVMAASTGCASQGADCAGKYFFHLGYITIPMMAFTAFLLITVLLFLKPEYEKKAPKPKKKQKSKKSKK